MHADEARENRRAPAAGPPAYRDLASYPETRIGAFDFSAATCTEPLWCGSADGQRACGDSWPGIAEGLCCFSQEDPLSDALRLRRTGPTQLRGIFAYAGNNGVKRRDPLGLQGTGSGAKGPCPRPAHTGNCAADAYADYVWGLCQFNEVDGGEWLSEAVLTVGGGVAGAWAGAQLGIPSGGVCAGPPGALVGGLVGTAIGFGTYMFFDHFEDVGVEAAIRRVYLNRMKECENRKCISYGPGSNNFFGGCPGGPLKALE